MGTFVGRVYGRSEDDARVPISATLRLSEAPDEFVIESDEYTGFAQQLPPGFYEVRVERFGYRVATDSFKLDPGQVVTRTMLLEGVWDYHFDPQTNVIDVHISRLRAKIDRDFDVPLLHTVRGVGYRLGGDTN